MHLFGHAVLDILLL